MQINHLHDLQELADLLEQADLLSYYDHGSQRVYVLEYAGQDIIAIADECGKATVIYPPEAFDAESGGSVHDQARMILGTATADAAGA